eukprot:gene15603-17834_t
MSIRPLSVTPSSTGTRIGYECLGYSDLYTERSIITKSLASGCKTIITKSRPGFVQTYELLCDLTEDEECQPASLFLGHIFAAGSNETRLSELDDIHNTIRTIHRPLNFVNLPIGAGHWELDTIRTNLQTLRSSEHITKHSTCKVGIDLDAASLTNASTKDVIRFIEDVLQPLADAGELESLTVATNAFTYAQSKLIFDWASTQNQNSSNEPKLLVIATDTMRSHAKRPGLLQSDYSFNLPHPLGPVVTPFAKKDTPNGDFKVSFDAVQKSTEVQALIQRVSAATDNLNMHLNKCMHIEKTFLGKISEEDAALVPRSEVLLGHMLAASLAQFKYPEEWQFYLRTEIEPKLADGLAAMKNRSDAHDDFASLYRPVVKNLLSSFRHLLQEIALLRSQEVLELIKTNSSGASDAPIVSSSLPEMLAKFTAQWSGAHYVTLPHTTVDIAKWGDAPVTYGLPPSTMLADA